MTRCHEKRDRKCRAFTNTERKANRQATRQTWDVEGVGLGLSEDPNSLLPLLVGGEALGVQGLSIQVVLHDIGDAHVSMHKPQLGKGLVQRRQHLWMHHTMVSTPP